MAAKGAADVVDALAAQVNAAQVELASASATVQQLEVALGSAETDLETAQGNVTAAQAALVTAKTERMEAQTALAALQVKAGALEQSEWRAVHVACGKNSSKQTLKISDMANAIPVACCSFCQAQMCSMFDLWTLALSQVTTIFAFVSSRWRSSQRRTRSETPTSGYALRGQRSPWRRK